MSDRRRVRCRVLTPLVVMMLVVVVSACGSATDRSTSPGVTALPPSSLAPASLPQSSLPPSSVEVEQPSAPTDPSTTNPAATNPAATSPATTDPNPPTTDFAAPLQLCSDVPVIETDVVGQASSSLELDPVFHGVLLTYARDHVDTFGGMWIDREANGTMVLAFTDDPGAHRAALAATAPTVDDVHAFEPMPPITDTRPVGEWGLPFDVVQVTFTEAELVGATSDVIAGLSASGLGQFGAGSDVMRNRISLDPPRPPTTEEAHAITEAVDALGLLDMVCLAGTIDDAPPDPVAPGTPLDVIVLPNADGSYAPDTAVECAGVRFTLGDLQSLTPIEDADPELQAVVTTWVGGPGGAGWPPDGWVVLSENDQSATIVRIEADAGADDADRMMVINAEMGRNGWIWAGAGGGGPCEVARRLPDGLGAVSWILDPAFPSVDATTTEVHVLATEMACTGGSEIGERLLGPELVESDDAVRFAFAAIPLTGGQTCPSNPSTPVTITLQQPLGDRPLIDGLLIAPLGDLIGP